MKAYYYKFQTPIGNMYIGFTSKGIVKLNLPGENEDEMLDFLKKYFDDIVELEENKADYHKEILSYLDGDLKEFSVPIDLCGTSFQKEVWNELLKIPYGMTKTYKDVAIALGTEKLSRAVGNGCNRNPIPIIVPCHRVVGKNFNLTGYRGGLSLKKKFLEIEGTKF